MKYYYLPLALGLAFALSACASVPVKQRAVTSLQASETALASAHDLEMGLCYAKPADLGSHCTAPAAAAAGLTDQRHVALEHAFELAFDAESKAALVLLTWKAGDPPPATLSEYQSIIQTILTLAQQLLPPGATDFIAKAQLAVTEGGALLNLVGVQ